MSRRKRGRDASGWLVLDKPAGLTSTAAVSRVRRLFDARKAGHAGTLDPLATGLLPIALGEATKTVPFVMDGGKVYRFTVRFGAETDTDDADGAVTATSGVRPDDAAIAAALPAFTGTIRQVPPRYSAIKVDGERAYDLARDGEDFELAEREIVVDALEVVERPDADTLVLEAACGKGTYVRAIARDLARALGTAGHVTVLRRLAVGPFGPGDMISLDDLEEFVHGAAARGENPDGHLLPVETALDDIPALAVDAGDAARLARGQAVLLRGRDAPLLHGPAYATSRGVLVAIGDVEKGAFHPVRVFNLAGTPGP